MFNDGDMFSLGLWANWEYKDNGTIQTVSIPLAKSGPQEGADILSRLVYGQLSGLRII